MAIRKGPVRRLVFAILIFVLYENEDRVIGLRFSFSRGEWKSRSLQKMVVLGSCCDLQNNKGPVPVPYE